MQQLTKPFSRRSIAHAIIAWPISTPRPRQTLLRCPHTPPAALTAAQAQVNTVVQQAQNAAAQINRLTNVRLEAFYHIFRHPSHDHKLGDLISKVGCEAQAYLRVQDAAQKVVAAQKLQGPFGGTNAIQVVIEGITIHLHGTVINGVLTISTMYQK